MTVVVVDGERLVVRFDQAGAPRDTCTSHAALSTFSLPGPRRVRYQALP